MSATICITLETKKRISLKNYSKLQGTKKENILCGLLVQSCVADKLITAEQFLTLYNWLVETLYQGIQIDFNLQPHLKDTKFLTDARSLKGDETENLINRKSCIKIANFISENNSDFAKALDAQYTDFETRLLLFSFSPSCPV